MLLFDEKRGRKGGRIEPDISGPYVTHMVTLSNSEFLKNKHNVSHVKPMRRSKTESPVSSQEGDGNQSQKSLQENQRPSVLHCAKNDDITTEVQANSLLQIACMSALHIIYSGFT